MGPKILATLKARGSRRNVLEWKRFSVVSASAVRAPPTVALAAPPRHLHTTADVNVLENATPKQLKPCAVSPINITVFLPDHGMSATLPHNTPVNTCAAVKTPCSIPD